MAGELLSIVNTPEVLSGVRQRHQWFCERLQAINARYGLFKEIRGLGLLLGCVLNDAWAGKAKTLSNLAAEEGVMILIAGANVVRFAPALNVSEEEVNSGLDRVERACARFVAGVSS
ncbi:succinylornithine transaminase [Klebsiella pneumoniae subsp. rhinoscleromatis]|nr:succinylornithine transaminase [Klebsiella pneumoniae subsp. rhinoscleromatis]VTN82878.1 succinylornithine transaminase [Klebsiella pneumoniae]